ncbi:MAG: hypothetical protein Q8P76_00855 [bacterium]|nr:hypothetical protein [bacterium]
MELFRELELRLVNWRGVWSAMMGHIGLNGWGCTTTRATGNVHSGSRAHPDERLIRSVYSLLSTT